jgi:hypothetical protein
MIPDPYVKAVIDFAFEQQKPHDAVETLARVGRIASAYFEPRGGFVCDLDSVLSLSKIK